MLTFKEMQDALIEGFSSLSNWEKKVWGWAWHIHASDQTAVSFLITEKGFRCSRHSHRDRVNMFAVIAGKIAIQEWYDENLKETILLPGQVHVVRNKVDHRFRVLESGMVIEIYWVGARVSLDDIYRSDRGGIDEEADNENS